ncbi:protease SohB [Aestuariibacter halophilus]|uniref:Protease SohB n=1 Tax=Fluctibacter halophilus TaxID=226011 RepID=A0ABS8G4J1_9ALTE|nr:protease SohB [Aestuariibacter halophilus]MCC2615502.1 protease SohB [Aestuariibacter halophilus]
MAFLYEYGLFIAKTATLVIAILVAVGGIVAIAARQKQDKGQLEFRSLSDHYEDITEHANHLLLSKDEIKKLQKDKKKAAKAKEKAAKDQQDTPGRLFVIDFEGSMDAHEVASLREEITAILCIATEKDEVLVRLESGGGVVHGYGLAASQLQRIRDKGIKLTVSVDKVAASGGYMMACVADTVLAAKFAIIGSIGVIAQLPNFNKLLKKNDIDFEQHTAGEFKRTLTVFGENTETARQKFREELEDVHGMFKQYVAEHRPTLDIDKVATGEYWYGIRAKDLGLVDELCTSDDYLLAAHPERQIYAVKYAQKKSLAERVGVATAAAVEKGSIRLLSKMQSLLR